jgi:hypothetical protein
MPAEFQNGGFCTGFDFQTNGAVSASDFFDFAGSGASYDNSNTRFGVGQSLKLGQACGMNLSSNLATIFDGVGVYENALPVSGWALIREWYDVTGGAVQVSLQYNGAGALQFFQGAGTGTPLGSISANGAIRVNQWQFVEVKIVFATGSGGSVQCRVWGPGGSGTTPVINSSGLNTAPTGNAYCNRVYFNPGTTNTWFDDWYMLDGTGAGAMATFLGNGRAQTDAANSDAGPNQFSTQPTQTTGNHYKNVDEIPLVSDANYNFDNNVGDEEVYGFPSDLASAPLFMNFWYRPWLDNSGPRTVEPLCKSSGSTTTGSAVTPSTTPSWFNFLVQNDPNTGSPWATAAAAEAADFGVEIAT